MHTVIDASPLNAHACEHTPEPAHFNGSDLENQVHSRIKPAGRRSPAGLMKSTEDPTWPSVWQACAVQLLVLHSRFDRAMKTQAMLYSV